MYLFSRKKMKKQVRRSTNGCHSLQTSQMGHRWAPCPTAQRETADACRKKDPLGWHPHSVSKPHTVSIRPLMLPSSSLIPASSSSSDSSDSSASSASCVFVFFLLLPSSHLGLSSVSTSHQSRCTI